MSRPLVGHVELAGRPAGEPGARDVLGVVPQEVALCGMLTPRENLDLFGRLQGLSGTTLAEAGGGRSAGPGWKAVPATSSRRSPAA